MQALHFLMCPPRFFGVEYIINPWMEGQIHATDSQTAAKQWEGLHKMLSAHGEVSAMTAVDGLPDLVFTANAGLIYRKKAIVSRFRFRERQPESAHFAAWFRSNRFETYELPEEALFEGAGDALLARNEPLLWLGHGMRSSLEARDAIQRFLDIEIEPLRLQNPSFYHLDTCFCPLNDGYLMYYPNAFDEASRAAIEKRVPAAKRVAVDDEDAGRFACNAVNIGQTVIANSFSEALENRLRAAGFVPMTTPLSEFMRAGGAAKCLSLRLNEG